MQSKTSPVKLLCACVLLGTRPLENLHTRTGLLPGGRDPGPPATERRARGEYVCPGEGPASVSAGSPEEPGSHSLPRWSGLSLLGLLAKIKV